MKGFGSYNDWPYYAASSNLSASATPFSVNHQYSNPIKESDSVSGDSSNQFGYSDGTKSQQYFNSSDPWNSYYGFTASDAPSRFDYGKKPYEFGFSGKGNQIGVGSSSFGLNQASFTGSAFDERLKMKLGCQDITDSHGEVPHMTGWEKHSLPKSADHIDEKSCWWRTTKPMPVDFSHTSVLQSPLLSPETHHEAPFKLAVDSGNHHFSYSGVYDKHLGKQDKLLRVDTVSSAPITGSVTDLNVGIFVPDGDLKHNNFYDIKEAHPKPSLGTAGYFGLDHLRMHLDRSEHSSSNNAMIPDMNVSGDVVDYLHKARHEFQNSNPNLGHLSLRLDAIQGVNSVDNAIQCGGDPCNPSVDSPCWKGAPNAHFSYYGSSEALPPDHLPENEKYFGSVTQEPQNFLPESNVKKPWDSSFQMHIPIVDQETSSAGSPRKFSETRFAFEDCKLDGAVGAGPFQSEPCCDYGLQHQYDTKLKENSVPASKPIDGESGSSHDEHQVTEENKLMSQKLHTLGIGGVDAGCNKNICSMSGTSHIEGHALYLSSSVGDAPATPKQSAGKVSTEKLDVQMLVGTMQNLSQLLLNHCSTDASELEERDCNILRNVISNLNTCVLKNAEQVNPDQECLFHQPETSRCAVESCEPQQAAQLTKIGSESSMDELENLLAQKKDLCFGSGTPHWMASASICPSGGAETTKAENMTTDDERENLLAQADLPYWMPSDSIAPSGSAKMTKAENMTKAIKNILSENFDDDGATESQTLLYKNLWLEAEAAICSVSFKARYNQMKIEMEKHSFKQTDMEEQSKSEVIPSLRSQNSAIEVNKCPNSYSSAQDLTGLHAINPEELSQLKFSSDMNRPNSLTPEAEGGQSLYSFIRNYAVSGTNKKAAGNDEASVMARYNVIKSRADQPCINTDDLGTPSNIADKLASREIDNQNEVNFCQDFPIPGKNKADYETSVLARFHILKSRAAEDSSSVSSTEKLFEFSGKGIEDTITTKDALEGESLDANLNSYTAVDKSIPKEIHLDSEDIEEAERCRTYKFQLPNYHSDGFASDWEHV